VGREAGTGDDIVEPSELFDRGIDRRLDVGVYGRVRGEGEQAGGMIERGRKAVEPGRVATGDGNAMALL
jgi:hypothetical protein